MSELQLSLVALGATIVAGIWAYNGWQARRHRKLAESLVDRDAEDILLRPASGAAPEATPATPDTRLEPHIGGLPASSPDLVDADLNELDSVRGDGSMGFDDPIVEPVAAVAGTADGEAFPLPAQLLSPTVDYIAAFESLEAIRGDRILQAQGALSRTTVKRVIWVGFDEAALNWEVCRGDAIYRRLRIGVQLADRRGPLDEPGLDGFYSAMQNFADEITAVADLPPRRTALERAQRLDRVCAGVDIQVGINVVCKSAPFAGTKIRALAEAAGMHLEGDGTYVRRDDNGALLFTLSANDGGGFVAETIRTMTAHGLTFLLDVPRVAYADRVFNQMLDVARRFAETLQGELVDDNRRPITDKYLTPIRKQIDQYQATMASHGLPAGSDIALRLFS